MKIYVKNLFYFHIFSFSGFNHRVIIYIDLLV